MVMNFATETFNDPVTGSAATLMLLFYDAPKKG